MSRSTPGRSYVLLDGLRGIAAIAVAVLHMPHIFAGFKPLNAGLAVDFFLQLSGFVIAFAYADRMLQGMPFGEYLWKRVNRLFPAYLLGFILGLLVAALALRYSGNGLTVHWTAGALACSVVPNFLMLPQVGCAVGGVMFPINPPMWSIFYELVVNFLLFAFVGRLLRVRRNLVFAAIALAGLVAITWQQNLAIGFEWRDGFTGLLRVTFSFLIGVTIFAMRKKCDRRSNGLSLVLFAILGLVLFMPIKNYNFCLAMVTLVLPAILLAGVKTNPAPGWMHWLCLQLGKTSYVLYVIHKPLYQLLYGSILKFAPHLVNRAGIFLGLGTLAFITLIAWGIASLYEPAARAFMDKLRDRALKKAPAYS